ncbi:MAG: tRNA (pseudouridine(54)-N(1))-methyltransferase TrmY [Methanosarcinales archaeon]|nr:tRNA (pseudouridine(54)-N(1))-methyltransferase TrmY [Methanosarcinales archaeon]
MREFIVVGHKARTDGNFNLNDLPGSGGRIDILCRCVNCALFLSHDLRRDVIIYLVLLGEPDIPKIVKFEGENVRYLNPDERSSGSLIKKALERSAIPRWRESTRGVWIRLGGLSDLLEEVLTEDKRLFYLQEDGSDIRGEFKENVSNNTVFVLGDHTGMTPEEEIVIRDLDVKTINIGPISLHADHCIILVNNEIDRTVGTTG